MSVVLMIIMYPLNIIGYIYIYFHVIYSNSWNDFIKKKKNSNTKKKKKKKR